MDSTAVFAAGYAAAAELAALGLIRVGEVSARRWTDGAGEDAMPFPHVGSMVLHRVIAAVATGAAVLLVAVIAVAHHGAIDVAALTCPLVVGVVLLARIASRMTAPLREPSAGPKDAQTPDVVPETGDIRL